ncbi:MULTISPECIES: Gfo/Idh/MocA family oxidoreductase [Flavobacteriaceae]|uniref:Gfo/Idh/MocA family oxidoreductase n=1 Tax=Flavobacteriaceae TaxID=49546 RepID=UPI000C447230|nr:MULTISPECIES: Gfo/Idh/MocA family oxidoreductase [Flavobacteriaceae]MAN25978.1 glycosyl hydrolase [Mesonia sp.]MAO42334.1 glycosyl hydrolase [Leeuwenhoekiella sp.]HCW65244.1 glycosyl hydrolase [Leeuwenhoekiella sp.]|tara:strand:+ start:539 stop:1903 length:1365 start_codon:yes stop_codon:yes gene_type:complete
MNSRRTFIKGSALVGAGISLAPHLVFSQKAKPLAHKLKLGFIGVGLRGINHLNNAMRRKDTEITAICDIDPKRIDIALDLIEKDGRKQPLVFGKHKEDYLNLLDSKGVDAVIIATPWLWHTKMAVAAMQAGVYAGLEVSASQTIEECWDLVNTHEATGTHMMFLENVNFRRDVMAVLNMVKQQVFGEMIHYRCGYQHDLREVKFNNGKQPYGGGVEFGAKGISEAKWRTKHSVYRNGDTYPTHGVGPIAAMANINRGNRFVSMTASATKAVGLHNHIVAQGGAAHPNAKIKFKQGDVITSTIACANGETIIVTHDTNLPRPYSLGFRVQGAMGLWEKDGDRIYIEGKSEPHRWDAAQDWLKQYDHPVWKKYEAEATGAGHGGMDYFVMKAFVESALANVAPPIDAYDAAAWSAITPLSEASIANNGEPQEFPDFTRGQWVARTPYNWMKEEYGE